MVGSVLVQRMREERDFEHIDPVFFSTSQAGAAAPEIGKRAPAVKDARDLAALSANDVLISCQGGDYTSEIYPTLRQAGWDGYWIDAASTLRMAHDSVLDARPGEPRRHRTRGRERSAQLHRPQLHRQPDADGDGRLVPRRSRRVDHGDDLSGRVRRRCTADARADRADGVSARAVSRPAVESCIGNPRDRQARR